MVGWNQPTQHACYELTHDLEDPTWRRAANRSNLATALALPTQVFFFLSGLVLEFEVGLVDWKDSS